MVYKTDVNRRAVKEKIATIKKIEDEMKAYKTLALISLEKLPDALLQHIRKKLREKESVVHVLKKPVIKRILDGKSALTKFTHLCDKPVALILAKMPPYELNMLLRESKKKRAAKIGEMAPFDIIVPEGETDIPPGPALSELKSAGLNVQIKGGKIVVSKESTVVKEGEQITRVKAGALQKLGILPFESAVNLLFCYDGDYVYSADVLNLDLTLNDDLIHSFSDGVNLSINAGYPTAASIETLLSVAYTQSLNLSINASLYSPLSAEQLLVSALRQGMALSSLEKNE